MNFKMQNKGISLIFLVITVIVIITLSIIVILYFLKTALKGLQMKQFLNQI
jgi:hypothetical protein